MLVGIAVLRGGPFDGRVVPFPTASGVVDPRPYRDYRHEEPLELLDTEHGPARVLDYRVDPEPASA